MVFDHAKLLQERTANGLTQEQLARAADLTTNTICTLENGKRPRPATATVEKLAKALNKPWFSFFAAESHESENGEAKVPKCN